MIDFIPYGNDNERELLDLMYAAKFGFLCSLLLENWNVPRAKNSYRTIPKIVEYLYIFLYLFCVCK